MNKITWDQRKTVFERAIKRYGEDEQLTMFFEEAAELQEAICKHQRGRDTVEHIAEELADLTIMTEQLRLIYGVNDDVCRIMDEKVERLCGRLTELDTRERESTEFRGKDASGRWVFSDGIFKSLTNEFVLLMRRGAAVDLVKNTDADTEFLQLRSRRADNPAFIRVEIGTLCRNTWLLDVFGNCIYERDVLRGIHGEGKFYSVVKYEAGQYVLLRYAENGVLVHKDTDWGGSANEYEVISNTIDEPKYAHEE